MRSPWITCKVQGLFSVRNNFRMWVVGSTIDLMPLVFRRGESVVFHKIEDCPQLTKKPARGTAKPIETLDLEDVARPHPCRTCYPDAPRIKVVRRYCALCNKGRTRPCAHNGGVRVTYAYRTNYVSLLRDPGDEQLKTEWVWPDRVHLYEPIAS